MDIQTLKYIIAVGKYGNFTTAAYQCSTSQSSLSKHIQNAEMEIGGIKLFNRASRPVETTMAGQEFIRYAEHIVSSYDMLLQTMVKYNQKRKKEITIGLIPAMGRLGLLPLVSQFKQQLPDGYHLKILDRPSRELIDLLKSELIDAAVIVIAPNQPFDIAVTYYTLMKNELVLIVSSNHILANSYSVDLKTLSEETFVVNDDKTGMHDISVTAAESAGFEIQKMHLCRSMDTMIDLVSINAGVGIISRKLAQSYAKTRNDFRIITLKDKIFYTIGLAINNQQQMKFLTKKFIKYAMEFKYE